jgi:DNA mismatch endonuclease, patch repair protein
LTNRPRPSSAAVSGQMSRLGQRDTGPEIALRSELHSRGLRFRVDKAPVQGVRSRADVVFGPDKVAVYVDGCFWHCCPQHGTMPKANAGFWERKLTRNRERDAETDRSLREHGWEVVRVWEHEEAVEAADRVEDVLRVRRRAG